MDFELSKLMLYMGASLLLILTPGPDMIYVITRAVSQGRTAGVLSACGVCCGLVVHTLTAALGLAILLQTSAVAYYIVKYLGAVYLVFLGIKSITAPSYLNGPEYQGKPFHKDSRQTFWQGLATNVLNPKIALFFMSFLPQFVHSRSSLVTVEFILLGLIYFSLCLPVLITVALISGKIGSYLIENANVRRRIGHTSGSILIGLGIYLALPGRN